MNGKEERTKKEKKKEYVPLEMRLLGEKCPKGWCNGNYCPKEYCPIIYCSGGYIEFKHE